MVNVGDLLQLNLQGPMYRVTALTCNISFNSGSGSTFGVNDTITTVQPSGKYGTITQVTDSGPTGTMTATISGTDFVQGDNITNAPGGSKTATIATIVVPTLTVALVDSTQTVPWIAGTPSLPIPYCIFRSPMSNGVAPLQLPTATVVDFTASGIGTATGTGVPTTLFNLRTFTFTGGSSGTFSVGDTVTVSSSGTKSGTIVQVTDSGTARQHGGVDYGNPRVRRG